MRLGSTIFRRLLLGPLALCLLSGSLRSDAQLFESAGIGVALIGAGLYAGFSKLKCAFKECCQPHSSWITPNMTMLRESLDNYVHGQHLVRDVVIRALMSHYNDPNPRKALVISLHGDTGTGKNFVSDIIASALYQRGDKSDYVQKIIASVDYPHKSKADLYKLELIDKVREVVTKCDRSLFIFDEVHKLPSGLIDAIKPFIDYHHTIGGVDFRKSVFIFLSNTGTKEILKFTLEWWAKGGTRADITIGDVENLVKSGAFNERGGLHMSELIQHSLVDFYVPFLPMERRHVELCAKDDLVARRKTADETIIRKVADDAVYFPTDNPLFATKGCKNVHQRVGYYLVNSEHY